MERARVRAMVRAGGGRRAARCLAAACATRQVRARDGCRLGHACVLGTLGAGDVKPHPGVEPRKPGSSLLRNAWWLHTLWRVPDRSGA